MAFNINAQVVLSGPKNLQKVRSSIQNQLSNVSVPVKIQISKNAASQLGTFNKQFTALNANLIKVGGSAKKATASLSALGNAASKINNVSSKLSGASKQVNTNLAQTQKQVKATAGEIEAFGKDAALAIRRFSAFTIATGAIFGFVRAVQNATSEAIKFERELARIVQVTGATGRELQGLQKTVDVLSVGLGLDANRLLEVSRIFAQTGQSVDQVRKSLSAVARASLAPTFGDIKKTTEGVIAALNQFNLSADRAESVLGSLNAVSKSFAVEADDLISVIRRAGGVFAASTKQLGAPEERLRELIGIFTAVRSTTRETADTIATGLRTIFTRIQRPRTVKFLEQFGIQLRATAQDAKDLGIAQGEFVGIFEAFRRISQEIDSLDTLSLAKVVEELGGIRQVGKLLPALREFEKAERARGVALAGTESISKDVAIATQTLQVQIEQLRERFQKFVRDVSQSATFQNLVKFALSTANAFITLADALRPALPLLTAIAGVKLTSAAFDFARGFIGGVRKGGGAGGVGGALGSVVIGGGGGGSAAAAATQKQTQSTVASNTQAVSANTTAVNTLNGTVKLLNTTANNLVAQGKAVAASAGNLVSSLAKLPITLKTALAGLGGSGAIRFRRGKGGKIPKFAKGGFVNGPSHAQGGVVAELEGGEFVVPKDRAKKFAAGGIVKQSQVGIVSAEFIDPIKKFPTVSTTLAQVLKSGRVKGGGQSLNDAAADVYKSAKVALTPRGVPMSDIKQALGTSKTAFKFDGIIEGVGKDEEKMFSKAFNNGVEGALQGAGSKIANFVGTPVPNFSQVGADQDFYKNFDAGFKGLLFENVLSALGGQPLLAKNKNRPFDFVDGLSEAVRKPYSKTVSQGIQYVDAKVTAQSANPKELPKKIVNQIAEDALARLPAVVAAKKAQGAIKKATGGPIVDSENRMADVAISDGELIVPPSEAKRNLGLLQRANRGFFVGDLVNKLPNSYIAKGPGTGTSDSIKTELPQGTFVVNAKDTERISNQTGFAAGGRVSKFGIGGSVKKRVPLQGGGILGALGSGKGATGILQTVANVSLVGGVISSLDFSSFEGLINGVLAAAIPLSLLSQNAKNAGESLEEAAAKGADAVNDLGAAAEQTAQRQRSANFGRDDVEARLRAARIREANGGVGVLESDLVQRQAARDRRAAQLRRIRAQRRTGGVVESDLVGLDELDRDQRAARRRSRRRRLGRGSVTNRLAAARGRTGLGGARVGRLSRVGSRLVGVRGLGGFSKLAPVLNKLGPALAKVGRGALSGPGGIAAAALALAVNPITDAIAKGFVGAAKDINGTRGFTAGQGGQTTAQTIGGIKGGVGGALGGAAIGGVIGSVIPGIGTAIGAAVGALIGGVTGTLTGVFTAFKEQAKFEELEKLQKSSKTLNDAFDKLSGEGIKNVNTLEQVAEASSDLTRQIVSSASAFQNIADNSGRNFFGDNLFGQTVDGLSKLSQVIGTGTTLVEKGFIALDSVLAAGGATAVGALVPIIGPLIGAGIGAIFDAINPDIQANAQRRLNQRIGISNTVGTARGFSVSLEAIPQEVFDKADENFNRLGQTILDSIPLDNLTGIVALGPDATFDELTTALESAGDNSETFRKQLEAYKSLQGVQITKEAKQLIAAFDALSQGNQKLQQSFAIGTASASKFLSTFQETGSLLEANAAGGEAFIKSLQARTSAAGQRLDFNVNDLFSGGFEELAQTVTDAGNGNQEAAAKIAQLAAATDQSADAITTTVSKYAAFTQANREQATAQAVAIAKQRIINDLLKASAQGLDALAAALQGLVSATQNAVSDFSISLSNIEAEVSRVLSTEQSVQANQRANVFTNGGAGRSLGELTAGVERVRSGLGGDASAFADLPSTVQLGQALPKALKDTIDELERSGERIDLNTFQDRLITKIPDFNQLSKVVQTQLLNNIEAAFSGARQGADLGAEGISKLLEEVGNLDQFVELSGQAASALEEVTAQLNSFNSAVLQAVNLQIQATRQRVDAELSILEKREAATDRFAKFEARSTAELARARQSLNREITTLLDAGGAGSTSVQTVDAAGNPVTTNLATVGGGDLLSRREGLEDIRSQLLQAISERTGVDPTDTAALASLDLPEIDQLQTELANVTSALEGTKKSIDVLANDTRILTAVENKLTSIQESRLTGRQRVTAALSQLANARTPEERARIVSEIQRPVLAARKVNQGQGLNLQEFASFAQSLDEGVNGVAGELLRRGNPGISEEDLARLVDQSRANLQTGFLRNVAPNAVGRGLGFDNFAADVIFNPQGASTEAAGQTPEEKRLLTIKDQILKVQEDLIRGTADQNAKSIADQQAILRDQLSKTKSSLDAAAEAFKRLREEQEELVVISQARAAQLKQSQAAAESREAEQALSKINEEVANLREQAANLDPADVSRRQQNLGTALGLATDFTAQISRNKENPLLEFTQQLAGSRFARPENSFLRDSAFITRAVGAGTGDNTNFNALSSEQIANQKVLFRDLASQILPDDPLGAANLGQQIADRLDDIRIGQDTIAQNSETGQVVKAIIAENIIPALRTAQTNLGDPEQVRQQLQEVNAKLAEANTRQTELQERATGSRTEAASATATAELLTALKRTSKDSNARLTDRQSAALGLFQGDGANAAGAIQELTGFQVTANETAQILETLKEKGNAFQQSLDAMTQSTEQNTTAQQQQQQQVQRDTTPVTSSTPTTVPTAPDTTIRSTPDPAIVAGVAAMVGRATGPIARPASDPAPDSDAALLGASVLTPRQQRQQAIQQQREAKRQQFEEQRNARREAFEAPRRERREIGQFQSLQSTVGSQQSVEQLIAKASAGVEQLRTSGDTPAQDRAIANLQRLEQRRDSLGRRRTALENNLATATASNPQSAAGQALFGSVRQRTAQEQLAFVNRFEGQERQQVAQRLLQGQNNQLTGRERQRVLSIAENGLTRVEAVRQGLDNTFNTFAETLQNNPFVAGVQQAADKLAALPQLQVALDANVGQVEVVLNGASLLSSFGEKVKGEILQAVSEKIAALIPNPDGSTNQPSLSSQGRPRQ